MNRKFYIYSYCWPEGFAKRSACNLELDSYVVPHRLMMKLLSFFHSAQKACLGPGWHLFPLARQFKKDFHGSKVAAAAVSLEQSFYGLWLRGLAFMLRCGDWQVPLNWRFGKTPAYICLKFPLAVHARPYMIDACCPHDQLSRLLIQNVPQERMQQRKRLGVFSDSCWQDRKGQQGKRPGPPSNVHPSPREWGCSKGQWQSHTPDASTGPSQECSTLDNSLL